MKKVPSTYDGKPVLSLIQYQFSVSLQALPDQYEPNHDNHPSYDFISLDQRLQKGIIKTIPIGQEITAYLFNEYPNLMRGTKGSEQSPGGENDTDIYHIYLNQSDTVKVTLKNFPQNANSRIIITARSGYDWEESPAGATYFEKKVKDPGNVFIEISRGHENRPLIYSTTPYKMLVTTGSAVITPQPYQPPVVTQPPVTIQPPVTTTVSAQTADWNTTAVGKRGKNGLRFTYTCSPNGSAGNLWGTDVYTDDSSICTAAVSAGLITFHAGGSVTIEIRPGQSSYAGSTRNGITSKGYGSWHGSFVFVGPISPQPYQPPITTIQMDKPNTFNNPNYKGYRLDSCLTWGSSCGEPAATKLCQEMGYTRAKSWDIAYDIGHITPTYVIGEGKICNQSFCDGFKFIECEGAAGPTTGVKELINNGALVNLNGWIIHEWYKPSNGKGEVTSVGDGVRFKSILGNNRIGIMQTLNADVSSCSSLVLSAAVKADHQTLTGTGWQGREAPVALFMAYTDINGTVHNQLSENPNDTARRMFWHGFYYADPAPPSLTIFGTKVGKSAWHTYTVDLAALNPRPKFIQFIGAEGAGWPQRDGKIGSMSLKCTGGEVSIQQPQYYQPPVASEPPQQYQPPVTSQPSMGNYPQGDIFTPQGQDDFWKGNIYERK
ncbi:MAG: LCCL domain-containing protein [Thermodesulfovibrionales bacterium]|nr:LCCL domain-containing protein [Thermodesulfovibrionales bacterium]